jgi:exopolysaccharide production protein ExoQ
MPPSLALLLWLISLVALLRYDPARDSKISMALWVPVLFIFITASRNPSQWLGGQLGLSAQALEDGNPLDRIITFSLILLAAGVLISRSFKWSSFFQRNLALVAYISFALMSVLWSDFPFIAIKRWIRDLGNYLVILVVLSDPRPTEAVRMVLRRLGFLLVPLSILLNKYYPLVSKQYDVWTGADYYVGATTSKNMLGVMCLVIGLSFFWDTVTRWPERKQKRAKRIILVDIALFAMTASLLRTAHSTTSTVCLIVGCLVIAAAHTKIVKRHPTFLKVLVPATFCLYLILSLGLNMNGAMAGAIGKDPTLTDRTKIWSFLLNMHTNRLIGTGYESFWLGSRLETFWETSGVGHLNEAHNGYLEVYLNLGLAGLLLLMGFVIASYRTICKRLKPFSNLASLGLALWITMLFYSVTEAGFRGGLMWLVFLLGGIAIPERATSRVRNVVSFDGVGAVGQVASLPLGTTCQRR